MKNRPLILSEFGGYVYKCKGHCFKEDKTFGYRIYKSQEKFQEGIKNLYLTEIIPLIKKRFKRFYLYASKRRRRRNEWLIYL